LVGSLLELMGLDLPVPDHSTLSRRSRTQTVARRLGWQRETDYGKRSMAETAKSRYKRIPGDRLHARKLSSQQAEAAIGVAVLNRMIDTGRPESVRVA
jgi:hypothetical protein